MGDDKRPDPDRLLAAVQNEEAQQRLGKLKIFLGMAPGVGKTFSMLESAHQRLLEGVDVVIGYVETHGRAETDEQAASLPLIPRRKIEYRGMIQEEMDVDAILTRKPQLVLVDELAHTNADGARHPKRYQDVLDLLAAGIDVYSTLNVQHLESRVDAVRQITGITIRETVPDLLIDIAAEVELIDLPPDELLKRLAEGKVYAENKVAQATNNFFRAGNLSALREMALRLTAERVEQQLTDYMQFKSIPGPWKSGERLMVAISASPFSERLIRWTRRMAFNLTAPWLAIHIETMEPLSEAAQRQLAHNISRVRELGGEVVTVNAADPIKEIMHVAHQRNVTQLVIGKPAGWKLMDVLRGGSLVDRLIQASGDIDVLVVSGDADEKTPAPPLTRPKLHSDRRQYAFALIAIVGAALISWPLQTFLGYQAIGLILLGTVVALAYFLGRGPISFAAALSAILWNFLYIPPHFTLFISQPSDWLMIGLYLFIALVLGGISAQRRVQEQATRQRADNAAALYELARNTTGSIKLDDVLQVAVTQIQAAFEAKVVVLLCNTDHALATVPHRVSTMTLDDREMGTADWTFHNRQVGGRNTSTMPTARGEYWPMITPGGVIGVIGVEREAPLTSDQESLLQTFVSHTALAVERELLTHTAQQADLLAESERLYATLLDSVSHELHTPLTIINGAASSLLDPAVQRDPTVQRELSEEIQISARRLNRLVNNLLDMSRIESGRMRLNLDWHDVSDLIQVSIRQIENELLTHDLVIDIAPNLPLVRMDFGLMEQVLVNLLHNAATYTPSGVRVRITATMERDELVLSVADRGPGLPLPPGEIQRVFEKFYRAPGAISGGTGLGLSICKGLVEAHGGTITAENRQTRGGARFTIRLPTGGLAPAMLPEPGLNPED